MVQTSYSSLTVNEAAANIILLQRHCDANDKKTEWGLGVWRWGRCFFRIDSNEKIFYRVMFSILSRVGLIKTEQNAPVVFKEIKDASEKKFSVLIQPNQKLLVAEIGQQKKQIAGLEAQLKTAEADRSKAVDALHKWVNKHQKLATEHHKNIAAHAASEKQSDELLNTSMQLSDENHKLKSQADEWKAKHDAVEALRQKAVDGLHKHVERHEQHGGPHHPVGVTTTGKTTHSSSSQPHVEHNT